MNGLINNNNNKVLSNYLDTLVNSFFKILPIKESEPNTLENYVKSLEIELVGCNSLFEGTNFDSALLVLISILRYLQENECEVSVVRREVFKSISIIKNLKKKYFEDGDVCGCN